jgi:hypothetical protein
MTSPQHDDDVTRPPAREDGSLRPHRVPQSGLDFDEEQFASQIFDHIDALPQERRPPSAEAQRGWEQLTAWMAQPAAPPAQIDTPAAPLPDPGGRDRPGTTGPRRVQLREVRPLSLPWSGRPDSHAWHDSIAWERLDVVLSRAGTNGEALHRPHQLLVAPRHADRAMQAAGEWIARRQDVAEADVTVLHLREDRGVDVGELAAQLHRHASGPIAATPNHILAGQVAREGGPWEPPSPCEAITRPTEARLGEGKRPYRRPFVAVVDTGIVSHPWFAESDWFAQVTADQIDPVPADGDCSARFAGGHGTMVAGMILNQAPTSFLMIERVLDADGLCDETQLLGALASLRRRLQATGVVLDVLNLSLGGYTLDNEPSPHLREALEKFGPHTAIVAAAGNHASSRPYWPAALDRSVAVAALTKNGEQRAEFSNFGPWIAACAVGTDVQGPYLSNTMVDGEKFEGYAQWSGTSFAAPHVAGVIAAKAAAEEISGARAAGALLDVTGRPGSPREILDFGTVVDQ